MGVVGGAGHARADAQPYLGPRSGVARSGDMLVDRVSVTRYGRSVYEARPPADGGSSMPRKLTCRAAATAIGALAMVTTGSASTERDGRMIRLGVRFHDDQLDLGAPGPSVGDELVVHDTLVNGRGRTVGSDAGVCTFTS